MTAATQSDASRGNSRPGTASGDSAAARPGRLRLVVWSLLAAALLGGGGAAVWWQLPFGRRRPARVDTPLDEQRAFRFLQAICELGPRPSGSEAMARQQAVLERHFQSLGAEVRRQSFDVRHPLDGSRVTMTNLIVHWHPERKERVLLCCHYDTRPYPDEDRRRPRGRFIGANDGASGPALFSELAYYVKALPGPVGVDFVLFDGEEFIFNRNNSEGYFLGSTHFARDYAGRPPDYRYRWGVLVDMIADKQLHLYYEKNSMRFARPLCLEIWGVAKRLGVDEFVPRTRHEVRDDHLPLNEIARIPTVDLIDFDYPRPGLTASYWHTTEDTPDKCSGESMAKVGWVLLEWLKQLK